jgi:hypothetical protein
VFLFLRFWRFYVLRFWGLALNFKNQTQGGEAYCRRVSFFMSKEGGGSSFGEIFQKCLEPSL